MNEPVREQHEKMKKLWNKYSRVDLHSEGDNWLQTGAIVDSTELQHTENKFILNKFPNRCDGCFLIRSEKEPKASDVSAAYWLYQHT